MKLLSLLLALCFTLTTIAADNIYTRENYPQPRMLDNNSRVFPISLVYTSDENGNVSPVGPITSDSWYYATEVASPITSSGTTVIKAATSGTKKNFVSGLQITNTGSAATVSLTDGSTVIWSGSVPATSGVVALSFNPPLKGTASTSTSFVNGTTGSSLRVSVQGFTR